MAIAATWASRITTVALEMVVPGLIGFWVDSRLGTKVLFGMVGFAFGLTLGIWHLVQMAKADDHLPTGSRPAQDRGDPKHGANGPGSVSPGPNDQGLSEGDPDGPASGGMR
jgi:hypothetical protein